MEFRYLEFAYVRLVNMYLYVCGKMEDGDNEFLEIIGLVNLVILCVF